MIFSPRRQIRLRQLAPLTKPDDRQAAEKDRTAKRGPNHKKPNCGPLSIIKRENLTERRRVCASEFYLRMQISNEFDSQSRKAPREARHVQSQLAEP